MYLVLSEISKKQQYIFRSNRIKENVGASFIVKYITEDLPKELLSEEDGSEIFRGGGKSLFLIKDGKEDSFIKKYSKKVIKDYSGVELFIVKLSFDMDKDNIINKIDEIYKDLARKKVRKNIIHIN